MLGLLQKVVVLAQLLCVVRGHTILTTITADGTTHNIGECILPWWSNPNFPVESTSSADLVCRTSDMSGSSVKSCPAQAGSKVTIEYHRNKKASPSDVISASHVGPCLVYMAPKESNGKGDVWFKIYENGYDSSTKQWCTDKLIANQGKLEVTIPADLRAGEYLMRTEIIALHGARRENGAQFYPNCAQIQVTGSGNIIPDGVAIPGIYKPDDPGILYARKEDNSGYIIPGPALYKSASGDSGVVVDTSSDSHEDITDDGSTDSQDDSTLSDTDKSGSESPSKPNPVKGRVCIKKRSLTLRSKRHREKHQKRHRKRRRMKRRNRHLYSGNGRYD